MSDIAETREAVVRKRARLIAGLRHRLIDDPKGERPLGERCDWFPDNLCREAADEISHLHAEIESLRARAEETERARLIISEAYATVAETASAEEARAVAALSKVSRLTAALAESERKEQGIMKWLVDAQKKSDDDSKSHPEGSENFFFYKGQSISYENVLSFVKGVENGRRQRRIFKDRAYTVSEGYSQGKRTSP